MEIGDVIKFICTVLAIIARIALYILAFQALLKYLRA